MHESRVRVGRTHVGRIHLREQSNVLFFISPLPSLAGHIPKELGELRELRELRLWSNKLTGGGRFDWAFFIFQHVSCARRWRPRNFKTSGITFITPITSAGFLFREQEEFKLFFDSLTCELVALEPKRLQPT